MLFAPVLIRPFAYIFLFFHYMMYTLNILSAIKKIAVNRLYNMKHLLFIETSEKKIIIYNQIN